MGVFSYNQRAWGLGMRMQPWLRGTPKASPAASCQGAPCMQIIPFWVMHMAQGTPGAT